MIELDRFAFCLAEPLFQETRFGALAAGTLEGGHPGRVFVEDAANPYVGLVCTRVGYYFLAGSPGFVQFNAWLQDTFLKQFAPQQMDLLGDPQILIFPPDEKWQSVLFEIFANQNPILITKKRMVFGPEASVVSLPIPPGFRLEWMTVDFLRAHPDLAGEAVLFWDSAEAFEQKSLGCCLVDEETGQVASTCSAVFVGAGEAEISIGTGAEYRRRGLARITASAFIAEALKRGLRPVWGCFPENAPSVALARSLGFVDDIDQPICFWEWKKET